jgi:hypothetical protein
MKNRISHATFTKKNKGRVRNHKERAIADSIWISIVSWFILIGIMAGMACAVFWVGRFLWTLF